MATPEEEEVLHSVKKIELYISSSSNLIFGINNCPRHFFSSRVNSIINRGNCGHKLVSGCVVVVSEIAGPQHWM